MKKKKLKRRIQYLESELTDIQRRLATIECSGSITTTYDPNRWTWVLPPPTTTYTTSGGEPAGY